MTDEVTTAVFQPLRWVRLGSLWVATVVVFSLYGWLNYDLSTESAVAFGVIGVGGACSIIAGVIVISEIRAKRMKKSTAVLHLITAGGVATALPGFIMLGIHEVARSNDRSLFQGEHSLWAAIVLLYAFWVAVCVFAVFLTMVLAVNTRNGI